MKNEMENQQTRRMKRENPNIEICPGITRRTIANGKTMELFIGTQAQHLFAATGCVSLPQIKQDDVEQRLEFERSFGGKHGHQLLGNIVGRPTCESDSRSFSHRRLYARSGK